MLTTVKIFRFDPASDKEPAYRQYEYRFEQYMTVLDVLRQISEEQDSSLCYHYCCRSGHCGLCGLMVNGKPFLSCRKAAEKDMTLEPLKGFPVKRDLMIDRGRYEASLKSLRLFLEREAAPEERVEAIDMKVYPKFRQISRCVECLCCMAACPAWIGDPYSFVGPAALALEARHFYDSRDTQKRVLISQSSGLENCVQCGLCSKVCPQDADPAEALGEMKRKAADPRMNRQAHLIKEKEYK